MDKNEIKNNLHCKQLLLNEFSQFFALAKNNEKLERILTDDFPKLEYKSLNLHNLKTIRHIGHRKLLISEIEFLTIMINKFLLKNKEINILYIGAAPGMQISYLSKLFTNTKFILFDPLPFSKNLYNNEQIEIHQDYFKDEDIIKYSNYVNPLLMISDIRNPYYDKYKGRDDEDKILEDMNKQKDWVQKIKPLGAMFKFRLPWTKGITNYLYGDIYLPVWGGLSTTECRLICDKIITENWTKLKDYDNTNIEQKMFYFNNVYRPSIFEHNINSDIKGLCHCYDCTSEIIIISNYLLLEKGNIENQSLINIIKEISVLLKRDLSEINPDPISREKILSRKKNILKEKYKYK